MEKAFCNEKLYTASDIAASYELEKAIRKASGKKELKCPDSDCPSPIIRYCHGEKKAPYFAHLYNCNCDYAIFDKKQTSVMRQVKLELYNHFCSKGYNASMDEKILSHHYTHLLLELTPKNKIAIELGTQRTTANQIDSLTEQCSNIGVALNWIIISNENTLLKEHETFFLKRHSLNESNNNDVLIVNSDGTEITQYKVDPNQYQYKGEFFLSNNYPEIYSETAPINKLVLEGDNLTINGFHARFNEWLVKKRKAFDKMIAQIEEETEQEEKRLQEQKCLQEEKIQEQKRAQATATPQNVSPSYEERRKSILPLIDQQNEQAIDVTGKRWARCEICGAIKPIDDFKSYGGRGSINTGKCRGCLNNG